MVAVRRLALVLAILLAAPLAVAEETPYGVMTTSGVTVPLSTYKGNILKSFEVGQDGRFKLGASYSVGARLLLKGFELGYSFTTFTFQSTSNLRGDSVSLGKGPRLQMHKILFGYRFTLYRGIVRPYIPLGLGAVIVPKNSTFQLDRAYGMDLSAGFGMEIRIVKHLYITVDARYHFNLIVQPSLLSKDAWLSAASAGLSRTGAFSQSDLTVNSAVNEAIGMFHYLDIRFGLSMRF
ncbi:MAG: outer membrane beta-barrel protein [Myxococcales bacterium]|nr:outer membrane beta-barrel protein [Myxococcales bacterium]